MFPADLAVRRTLIVKGSFLVFNFIQSPAVGAFNRLSHVTDLSSLCVAADKSDELSALYAKHSLRRLSRVSA